MNNSLRESVEKFAKIGGGGNLSKLPESVLEEALRAAYHLQSNLEKAGINESYFQKKFGELRELMEGKKGKTREKRIR